MSSNMVLQLLLQARDRMSAPIRNAVVKSQKDFEALQNRIKATSQTLGDIGKKALIGGAAIGAFAVANLNSAAAFQAQMGHVSTLVDTNVESMHQMSKQTLSIFRDVPVKLEDTTGALYNIRSAGIFAADSMDVLERSAKLALAGQGSTAQAVDLVTSSINAFNLKGKEQQRIYDVIFKSVKYGKTNIAELSQGFGAVAGTVAAAGIKVDEYIASVTAITTVGNPASQAHTQIKAAIAGLTRGTKEQQKIFQQLHAKDFNDLIQKSGGMVGAFSKINNAVHGNKSALISLLGSIEAYNAFLGLTGGQNKAYVQTLNDMRNGTNAVDEAYRKESETIANQTQRFKNLSQAVSIEFGNSLVPAFKKVLDFSSNIVKAVTALPDSVKSSMSISSVALAGGALAFGGLTLAASGALKMYGEFLSVSKKISDTMSSIKIPDLKFSINGKAIINEFDNIRAGFVGFGSTIKANTALMLTNARSGLAAMAAGFKAMPANIAKSAAALMSFVRTQMLMLPFNLARGYEAIGRALTMQVQPLKALRGAMLGFNAACSVNPIGLLVAAVAAAAFLIYKYWKPIAGFFRGLWAGVVESTRPLHPVFNKIAMAVKPICDWFKKLVKPVDDVNGRAENFGKTIGRVIGGAINWVAKLIQKVEKLNVIFHPSQWGKRENQIDKDLAEAEKRGNTPVKPKPDGSYASGLSFVPFDGFIAELHKGERILTKEENSAFSGIKASGGSGIMLTYAPTIHADAQTDVKAIKKMLEEHERKMLERLKTEQRRREARAYA